jgi:hypothetical protein
MALTFYCRHTSDLAVTDAVIEGLWTQKRIAVHYPEFHDGMRSTDNESMNPDDYSRHAKGVIRALVDLARDGGYVWAEYRGHNDCLIGHVAPNSEINILREAWHRPGYAGRTAILKSVQLTTPAWEALPSVF